MTTSTEATTKMFIKKSVERLWIKILLKKTTCWAKGKCKTQEAAAENKNSYMAHSSFFMLKLCSCFMFPRTTFY